MPGLLRRLEARGFLVRDMYKPGERLIVTHVGLLSLGVSVAALLSALALRPSSLVTYVFLDELADPIVAAQLTLFTICGYGIVGAIDDRRPLPQFAKAVIPITLALPSANLALSGASSSGLFVLLPWLQGSAQFVLLIVIPLFILVVTNLVNMHSGFNGLQSGLSLMLLGAILLRLIKEGRLEANLSLVVVLGCTLAFFPFNRLPARAIEGNVGSYLVGSAIGVGIAVNGLFFAGAVMLAPHILDFALFLVAKIARKPFVKFGKLRVDGTIEAPYPFKLKFLLPYYFRLTERQAVWSLYGLTAASCLLSFLIPA